MGNLQDGVLALANLKFLPKAHEEFPRLFLQSGDLIFNRTNSPELVGKCAVFNGELSPCSFASYLIRVAFDSRGIDSTFVSSFINSTMGREWVKKVMVQQVGQASVNGTKLKECLIPLPPRPEQVRLITEISKRLGQVKELTDSASLLRLGALRAKEAILSKAFSGRLVPQNPAEGTGHDLLAQILKDKHSESATKETKKTKAAKAPRK